MTDLQSPHDRPARRAAPGRLAPLGVVAEWAGLLGASLVALARFFAGKDQALVTIRAPRDLDEAPFEEDDHGR